MKQVIKRIIAFSVSICIVALSILLCPASVYASGGFANWLGDAWESFDHWASEKGLKIINVIPFVLSQYGCLVDHDFSMWISNEESLMDYWNENNVIYDSSTDSITFSEDFVDYLLQKVKEYAEETNPFYVLDTIRAKSVLASSFSCKEMYQEFLDYTSSHRITAFNASGNVISGHMILGDVTPIIKGGGGFVLQSEGINIKKYNSINAYTFNGDWLKENVKYDRYDYTFADGAYSVNLSENCGVFSVYVFYMNNYPPTISNGVFGNIVTEDGGRIRVFKSQVEFMQYDAGQRKVYFGSDFYNKELGEVKVDYDDLIDFIDGKYDDFLEDLRDIIADNPSISEDDLEKLIDELISKIGEIGGQIGDKTDQTNTILGGISSTLDGVASSLSGYFSSVLSALSGLAATVREGFMTLSEKLDMMIVELGLIYESMGDMTEEEVSEKTDSLLSQLFSAFSEIGDVLKGKFPFCLPNDLYTMLALLAGDEVSVSPGAGGGDGNGDIMICAYGAGADDSNAPVFEIPFVVGSADIEERIIIDLSPFEYISKLSRTLMTLYYCACLMQLTLKVIDLGKELGDD